MELKFKNPATAFMLFFMVFFISIIIINELVVYVLINMGVASEIFASTWYIIAIQVIRFVLPVFVWLAITNDKFKRHMPNQPMDMLNIVYVSLITLLAIPAMMLVSGISSQFANNDIADLLVGFTGAGHSWLMLMLAFAVTPGIVEELAFRGYIQSVSRGSVTKIAVFNGFLFGLMHLNLHQFAYTFILGALFAYFVYYTKNIWSAIFAHFLVNGVNITMMYLVMRAADSSAELGTDQTISQAMYDTFRETDPELAQIAYDAFSEINLVLLSLIMIGILAIFTTTAAVILFRVFIQHNNKRNAEFASTQIQEPVIDTTGAPDYKEAMSPLAKVDWCLVLVIAIYILLTIVLPMVGTP